MKFAGKSRDLNTRTTVYKKANDMIYNLKMKTSRTFFSEAINRFGNMPFTLRAFEDEAKAKMGVVECERHALIKPYQVLLLPFLVVSEIASGKQLCAY